MRPQPAYESPNQTDPSCNPADARSIQVLVALQHVTQNHERRKTEDSKRKRQRHNGQLWPFSLLVGGSPGLDFLWIGGALMILRMASSNGTG